MLHRIDWLVDQRAVNASFDAITTQAWSQWSVDWLGKTTEEQDVYRDLYASARAVLPSASALAPIADAAASAASEIVPFASALAPQVQSE